MRSSRLCSGSKRTVCETARVSRTVTSNELDLYFASDDLGGPLKGFDRHVAVSWVEHAVDLGSARAHQRGKAPLAEFARLHRLRELPGDDFLDRARLELLEHAFPFQELVDRR